MKLLQENRITTKNLWPCQLFVNNKQDIKCALLVFSTVGFKSHYESVTDEEKFMYWDVFFVCNDNKHDHLMMSLITYCVPWTTVKRIIFWSFPPRFTSMIQSFIHENKLGECHILTGYQMELDKKAFNKREEIAESSHASGISF